jgi:exopolysaccharide production protein ExoQ
MLGRGYNAFWQQGNTDAEGLWQYFGIYNRSGFTFHNTLVDVLVTMGWIGAGVFVATMLIGVVTLIRRFVMRPNLSQVFWISILLYQLARTPIETIGVAPFYFSTALCFAALGASFGRVKTAPADQTGRVPHQPIRELRAWTVEPTAGGRVNPRHSLRLRP